MPSTRPTLRPAHAPHSERERIMNIGMLVFPNVTATDYVAPADLLVRMPGAQLDLVWKHTEPMSTELGWEYRATARMDRCGNYDVFVVPGGPGVAALLEDDEALDFVARQGAAARWVAGICTGPLVLGAAGLLAGYRATCHWASHDLLALVGAVPVDQRVVVDRNRVTGAGVTSGIDCALQLIALICGEDVARGVQLFAEYDPQPPFEGGSPRKTPAAIVAATRARVQSVVDERRAILSRRSGRAAPALGRSAR